MLQTRKPTQALSLSLQLQPMTLTFELGEERVKVNKDAKYQGRSYCRSNRQKNRQGQIVLSAVTSLQL